MVCFTDKCDGLRYIPILNLKSYYEETKRKNNINVGIVLPIGNNRQPMWSNAQIAGGRRNSRVKLDSIRFGQQSVTAA